MEWKDEICKVKEAVSICGMKNKVKGMIFNRQGLGGTQWKLQSREACLGDA